MNKVSIPLFFMITVISLATSHVTHTSVAPTIITRTSKNILPEDLLADAQKSKMSILTPKPAEIGVLYKNYPNGGLLFPNDSDLAAQFNTMVASLQKNPDLITFSRKMYITSLSQIYAYLMKIYTNFNLVNPGTSQQTATTTADVSAYLLDEATYATNRKKLIMNHFINIVQAQFKAAILSYVPTTAPDMAVSLGNIFVHNDCSIDLTSFTKPQTDPAVIASQAVYLEFLKQYISFFQAYTSHLGKSDAYGVNEYYSMAQKIHELVHPTGAGRPTVSMNPEMFFYDVESLRSIQFIPFVAGKIPANAQLIPWAPSIVNAAIKKSAMNGHEVAYFTDAAGKKIDNQNQAAHLYLLTETGPNLFEQELLAQPAWLNNQEGSIKILRSCLGDFSAIVGTGILDVTLETIIQKALGTYTAQAQQAAAAQARAQIQALTLAQIQTLQIQTLTSEQIQALTPEQIEALTPVQLQIFTSIQLQAFNTAQMQAFSRAQIKAFT